MPDRHDYLSSKEALKRLGVRPQTLYAYVSRGWIRSIPSGKRGRRLYLRSDIERVKARADARAGHEAVAAAALRWGEPVLSSSITEISPAGPRYRGVLATDFVREGTRFETVAERLWNPLDEGTITSWAAYKSKIGPIASLVSDPAWDPRIHPSYFLATAALLAGGESLEDPFGATDVLPVARDLVANLAVCLAYIPKPPKKPAFGKETIAETVAAALGAPETAEALETLNACLVLCADHELSQTTFVARIAASAAADFGSCVSAAILSQPRLGNQRSPGRTEDFLWTLAKSGDCRRELDAERSAGRAPPGFNHPLYPRGDPRGRTLIELAQRLPHQTPVSEDLYRTFEVAISEFEFLPTFDAGLACVRAALDLPRRSPGSIFVVGRSAGWIAHTLEQWTVDAPLRPRARYVGAIYTE